MKRILHILSAALILFYIFNICEVAKTSYRAPIAAQGNYVVVLGKALHEGALEPEFKQRLARAGQLHSHDPRDIVISGGNGEAQAALLYLEIFNDSWNGEHQSTNTWQNLKNSLQHDQTIVVSSRYHLHRVNIMARHLGYSITLVAAEDSQSLSAPFVFNLLKEGLYCMLFKILTTLTIIK